MKFAFIRDLDGDERRKPRSARIPVFLMCEVLDVSRSGYYGWLKREQSDRERQDMELTGIINKIHEQAVDRGMVGSLGVSAETRRGMLEESFKNACGA